MKIIRSPRDMQALSAQLRLQRTRIGLVPTMGALHQGHASLVTLARQHSDECVVSIFVNPSQFGPNEDFAKYPRAFDSDCALAESAGATVVFAPDAPGMYPPGYNTYVSVERLTDGLCGASRPRHFRGVATVVLKFFNIVMPDFAVFGQKDAQQVLVLKRMVEDLNVPVRMMVAPTVREADGLAMSSRNAYLTPAERAAAPLIYAGLVMARQRFEAGERNSVRLAEIVEQSMSRTPLLKKEYIDIVDMVELRGLATIASSALLAVACRTQESTTRLIDNTVLGGEL